MEDDLQQVVTVWLKGKWKYGFNCSSLGESVCPLFSPRSFFTVKQTWWVRGQMIDSGRLIRDQWKLGGSIFSTIEQIRYLKVFPLHRLLCNVFHVLCFSNRHTDNVESFGSFVERHSICSLIVTYKHCHAWWHNSVMCTPSVALYLNESHELQELTCNCPQTKSSLSVRKKGVFWGTLEWILSPWRETNWARQASLREWLKLVCSSASAPSNKEEKTQGECERRGGEAEKEDMWGKLRAKGAWLDHGTLMVPMVFFFYSAAAPQSGKSWRAWVNREDITHRLLLCGL